MVLNLKKSILSLFILPDFVFQVKSILFFLFVVYSCSFVYFTGQPLVEFIILGFALTAYTLKPLWIGRAAWFPYLNIFFITISIALIMVGHVKYFIVQPYKVRSESMMPLLHPGDTVLVEKMSMGLIINFYERELKIKRLKLPWQRNLKVGDVVIFHQPQNNDYLIKRIHSIENQKYCMYGDNLEHSLDSRSFGCIDNQKIIGRYLTTLKKVS